MDGLKIQMEQEISKVLVGLGTLSIDRFKRPMVDKVMLIHCTVHTKSKFFCVKKLVPLVIYVFLTLRHFTVNKSDLIQVSEIFYEEFNCFFRQLKHYMLKYNQCGNYV